MWTKIAAYFKPPEFESIERNQKARFIHYALLAAAIVCGLLGAQNMSGGTGLNIFLFASAGISLLCILANKRGYYMPVAIFMTALMIVLITYSLLVGVGLKDAGLIAYPIFIIFTSYLFTKRAVIFTTSISIVSVFSVYFMEGRGYLPPAVYSDKSQLVVILILFPAAGFLLWVVVDNWEKGMRHLRDAYDLTLAGWGQALEFRDSVTEGHSQRVVAMTIALARELGVPRQELEHIRRGALLHDIGKMAIPDAILLKHGSLTPEEWQVVKQHPAYARSMLERIPYLTPALAIPYSHHEKWDGSGYPQGLSKEAIPFAARIFAVVDVWDAITSDRPYRKAWSYEQARAHIQEQSGAYFDPRVAAAFLNMLEKSGPSVD